MVRHVGILRQFEVPVVVAINSGEGDSEEEVRAIREAALSCGAFDAVVSTHFLEGGAGAKDLAAAVLAASGDLNGETRPLRPLYPLEMPVDEKIMTIATKI